MYSPDGYEPYDSNVNCNLCFSDGNWTIIVFVGDGQYYHSSSQPLVSEGVDRLTVVDGKLQMGVLTFHCVSSIASITVWLRPSVSGIQAWKQRNWAKLFTAHKTAMSQYENKLAELQMLAGITFQGNNPDKNLQVMRTEIKRGIISIFTEQQFRTFGSVKEWNGDIMINYDLAKKQGYYISFFEQAFEWENMTWATYPYYWARRSTWPQRLNFNDPDPLFDDFLKAGACRVQIPTRVGFENAVDHFMKHGEPWAGGSLPTVSDELYLPMSAEISERLQRPGLEIPIGDTWEVKLPTSLVKLRADDQLPRWVETLESGKKIWVENTPVVPVGAVVPAVPVLTPGSTRDPSPLT